MKLTDLIPQDAEFKINGITLKLRKVTLLDRAWVQEKFGNSIEKVFTESDLKGILSLVYHQLDNESKKRFLAKEIENINDLGVVEKKMLYGPDALAESISDNGDITNMMKAYVTTLGISNPIIEDIEVDIKKNTMSQIGEKSSTASQANTDIPLEL